MRCVSATAVDQRSGTPGRRADVACDHVASAPYTREHRFGATLRVRCVHENAALWRLLKQIEPTRGVKMIELGEGPSPLGARVVVKDGRVCCGAVWGEAALCNSIERQDPALTRRLLDMFGWQRSTYAHERSVGIIPERFACSPRERRVLRDHMVHALAVVSGEAETSPMFTAVDLERSLEPLTFRPIDLLSRARSALEEVSEVARVFDELMPSSSQAWLFDCSNLPFSEIAGVGEGDEHSLDAALLAREVLDHFLGVVDAHGVSPGLALLAWEGGCWTCVADGHFAALFEHMPHQLGRVLSVYRRVRGEL